VAQFAVFALQRAHHPIFCRPNRNKNREFWPKGSSCGEPRLGKFQGTCIDLLSPEE
jgi:hypothetical protein